MINDNSACMQMMQNSFLHIIIHRQEHVCLVVILAQGRIRGPGCGVSLPVYVPLTRFLSPIPHEQFAKMNVQY